MLVHIYTEADKYAGSVYQEGGKPDYAAIFARYPTAFDLWTYTGAGAQGSHTSVRRKSISREAIRKASGTLYACFSDAPKTAHAPQEFSDWMDAVAANQNDNARAIAKEGGL